MRIEDKGKYIKLAVISSVLVAVDQITKYLVDSKMSLYESITIIPIFFNITYLHNPGGAFGFLAEQSQLTRAIMFLFVSSIALCFIFYFYINTPKSHPILSFGLAMIFGGALGNLVDRIRLGYVIDFLDFSIPLIPLKLFNPWPAFNIADSAITIGMSIFVFHIILKKMPDELTSDER